MYRETGNALGNPGPERRDPRDVRRLRGLGTVAEDDLVEAGRIEIVAGEQFRHRHAAELVGRRVLEHAAGLAVTAGRFATAVVGLWRRAGCCRSSFVCALGMAFALPATLDKCS